MFSRLSNKNRVLKKPDNCAKTDFLLASDELTVLPSTLRKSGCLESTVLPEEPFFQRLTQAAEKLVSKQEALPQRLKPTQKVEP
jgi:hypothetical protein